MAVDPLLRGREAYQRGAWGDAFRSLSAADAADCLGPEDLNLMATAAYLTGRTEAAAEAWALAHRRWSGSGEVARAVRCAFWLVLMFMQAGELARGGGWLGRATGMLEESGLDCVERAYLRIPAALQTLGGGDATTAYTEFDQITTLAETYADSDLRALGMLGRGQALVAEGQATRGAAMLDEAMLAVTSGDVSPVVAGLVYCGVIITCNQIFDLRRAKEWTAALSRWCATQQDLAPYRGQCLVHRSEIMQLRGDWSDAMAEARRACEHLADPPGDPALGMARYQQAELLRLRGEFARAEQAYRGANQSGHPVQPGLAALRLAQGRVDDALAAVRRVLAESDDSVQRARVLAVYAEIALAADDVHEARDAVEELAVIADRFDSPYLRAVVGYARGSVLLAEGDAAAASRTLRRSLTAWQELDAPYEAARARLLMVRACRSLGDHDTAEMELDTARTVFERLGAAPALALARELAGSARVPGDAGLTTREAEVLRLVATGAQNRQIAGTLVISEKTVARHVANLFTKLGVSSRAAATAYAYRHDLI